MLLHLRDDGEIRKFAKRAIEKKMSVAKLEEMVMGLSHVPNGRAEDGRAGRGGWIRM